MSTAALVRGFVLGTVGSLLLLLLLSSVRMQQPSGERGGLATPTIVTTAAITIPTAPAVIGHTPIDHPPITFSPVTVIPKADKQQQQQPKETKRGKEKSFLLPLQPDNTSPQACSYKFKVYVYELSKSHPSVQLAEEARVNRTLHVCKKCILEQFAIEYILYDFFTQFCGRTTDPEQADFFYLPIIRDAEYRTAMDRRLKNSRAPSPTEQALLLLLEKKDDALWNSVFSVTSKYWKRHSGADHIIVMPAPVTNLRHESSMRGFFHYMLHLHPPIFVAVEYSKSFIQEYPVCSRDKNMLMPYPTTDPDLYSGKLHKGIIKRSALLFYAGGMHGDCIEVRKALHRLMQNASALPGILPDVRAVQAEREHGFRAATFCPVPVGDSPTSKRMYDVMNFGCIPVVLSDDLVYAYTREVGGPVDESLFSLRMPQAVVQYPAEVMLARYRNDKEGFGRLPGGEYLYDLLEGALKAGAQYQRGVYVGPLVMILQRVAQSDIDILRSGVESFAPTYRYYRMEAGMSTIPTAQHKLPDGGTLETMSQLLAHRKSVGVDRIHDSCQAERSRKGHKYIGRYPCEYQKKGASSSSMLEYRRRLAAGNDSSLDVAYDDRRDLRRAWAHAFGWR